MREPGFYWVNEHNQGWIIAQWTTKDWYMAGLKYRYDDSEFTEIDERRIVREFPGLTEEQKANIAEYVKSRSTAKGILDL